VPLELAVGEHADEEQVARVQPRGNAFEQSLVVAHVLEHLEPAARFVAQPLKDIGFESSLRGGLLPASLRGRPSAAPRIPVHLLRCLTE
jgi:hypothetical protein